MKCDILISGGHMLDAANNIDKKCDIAIKDGKILSVGESLTCTAKKHINAEDFYVTPGLIDMHCHCYPTFPFANDTLPNLHPDATMPQNGVTTAVDAGTCGVNDFEGFKKSVIDKSSVRVLAFLNIASDGMLHMMGEDEPENFDVNKTAETAQKHADCIVGIKTAHYWVGKPFNTAHAPWASVDAALSAAEKAKIPCMVDMQPTLPERTYSGLLSRLRCGDIHTHMYAQQFHIFDEGGNLCEFITQAKKRGVLFDLGHGAGSFWFRNAIPAIKQGHSPDIISTDLYLDNIANPVLGLINIMSKMLCMGMSLSDVISRVTLAPAKALHRQDLGTLSVGACADVALIKIQNTPVRFADSGRAAMSGSHELKCALTIREGKIVYNPYALTLPDWETAPEEYYTAPGVILN